MTDTAAALAAAIDAHAQALARHQPGDSGEAVELALTRANAVARVILSAPARTREDIRAKVAAMRWEIAGEAEDGFTMDAHRAASLRGLLDDLAVLPG